jgi:hypothetical protein
VGGDRKPSTRPEPGGGPRVRGFRPGLTPAKELLPARNGPSLGANPFEAAPGFARRTNRGRAPSRRAPIRGPDIRTNMLDTAGQLPHFRARFGGAPWPRPTTRPTSTGRRQALRLGAANGSHRREVTSENGGAEGSMQPSAPPRHPASSAGLEALGGDLPPLGHRRGGSRQPPGSFLSFNPRLQGLAGFRPRTSGCPGCRAPREPQSHCAVSPMGTDPRAAMYTKPNGNPGRSGADWTEPDDRPIPAINENNCAVSRTRCLGVLLNCSS